MRKPLTCLMLAIAAMPISRAAAQTPDSLEGLSKAMRPLMISAMPAVLYEKKDNWGHQRTTFARLVFKGVKPIVETTEKNDGYWRAIKIVPQELNRTFEFKLSDLKQIDAEKQAFKAKLGFQAGIEFDHQLWQSGARLFAGNTRARAQLQMDMDIENTIRIDKDKAGLPAFVFRLKVTKAELSYRDVVVEHTAGVGGSAAKLIGDAMLQAIKQWKPSIERDLIERANTAVVNAADTKEIIIGLSGLTKK